MEGAWPNDDLFHYVDQILPAQVTPWTEVIVVVGHNFHHQAGRSNLLAPSAVAESDTPQDSRALMASLHTPFAGCRPESSLEVACLASLLATAAIASCFEVRKPSRSLSHVATGAKHAGHPEVVLQLLEVLAPLRVHRLLWKQGDAAALCSGAAH